MFGGADGNTAFGDTWVWDGVSWTQKFPTTNPPATSSQAMACDVARQQVNDRAQLVPGCTHLVTPGSTTSKLNNYFNTPPVIGDDSIATGFGNSGVGIANGPAQDNTDIALIKNTAIRWPQEGTNLEFRAEFFNAFNTPQFANPDTNFTDATFGKITSTAVNPRIIQFALKFNF